MFLFPQNQITMDANANRPEATEAEHPDRGYSQDKENLNVEERPGIKRDLSIDKEERKAMLRKSGNCFIRAFQKLLRDTEASAEDKRHYMPKVLHAIFFLGHINVPQLAPTDFIPPTRCEEYRRRFPKPFREYRTHFPSQTPYSILLEYICKVKNQEEKSIMEELLRINTEFWITSDSEGNKVVANDFSLSASVICCSYVIDPNSPHYFSKAYGASIAYKGRVPRKIMLAISVLYVWDKAVSYAVCQGNSGRGINFLTRVHCNAQKFNPNTSEFKKIPPCVKCNQMFVVEFDPEYQKTNKNQEWLYGNCAETEAMSNLLHRHEDMRSAVLASDNNGEKLCRRDIEERFTKEHEGKKQKEAKALLQSRDFKVPLTDWQLFTPNA